MSSFFGRLLSSSSSSSSSYAPSAPSLPDSYDQQHHKYSSSSRPSSNYSNSYQPQHHQQQQPYMAAGYGYGGSSGSTSGYSSYGGYSNFPPGTHPDVIRTFESVDRDRSGFIDEKELQQALSSGYQKFHLRTIRLLIFLFKNPHDSLRIGPKEFTGLWSCLGQWRGIFERYDRDRSGKIDLFELRDALYGLGFAIPSSVLQVLMSKYDDGSGRKIELNFDSFVERGHDFNFLGTFLFGAVLVLMVFALIQILFPLGRISIMIYGCLASIIFCGYIIYDTDNLIKRFSYDEYIWAAVCLYLDIINLFLSLLTIFRAADT